MYIRILILFTLCFHSSFSQKDIFFPFKTENNWITIHNNKKIIHPQVYDYVNYYDKFGYAYFIANKKYGIIDSIGNEILNPIYDHIEHIFHDIYLLDSANYRIIKSINKKFSYTVDWFKTYDENWMVFANKSNVLLLNNEWVKPKQIDKNAFIESFENYLILKEGKTIHIFSPKGDFFDENIFGYIVHDDCLLIKGLNKNALIANKKEIHIPFNVKQTDFFDEHFYYTYKDSLYLIDYKLNKVKFQVIGSSINIFNEYYLIKNKKSIALITKEGKFILDYNYQSISKHNNSFLVCKNNLWGVLNSNFREIIKPQYDYYEIKGDFMISQVNLPNDNTRLKGVYSFRKQKIILQPIYYKVIVSDTLIKAWSNKTMVMIILYKNHQIKEEIYFDQVISINQKQKVQNSINFDQRLIDIGWFLDTTNQFSRDSTFTFYNRWGFRRNDSILLKPVYKNIDFVENANFSLLKEKMINQYKSPNNFLKKTFDIEIVNNEKFKLIPLSNPKKINPIFIDYILKDKFNQKDYTVALTNDFIGIVTKNGVLKPVNYYSEQPNNNLIYCTRGEVNLKKSRFNNDLSYSQLYKLIYPIDNSDYKEELSQSIEIVDAKWNILNKNGDSVFQEPVDYLESFKRGSAIYKSHNYFGIVFLNGKKLEPKYNSIKRISVKNKNLFLVSYRNNGFIYYDTNYNKLPLNNLIPISKGEKTIIFQSKNENLVYNDKNEYVGKTKASKILEYDLIIERKDKKFVIYNDKLQVIGETKYKPLSFISPTVMICSHKDSIGIVDIQSNLLIPEFVNKIINYDSKLLIFKSNSCTVLDCKFKKINKFKSDKVYYDLVNQHYLIQKENKIVILDSTFKKLYKWENKSQIDTFYNGIITFSNHKLFKTNGENLDKNESFAAIQILNNFIIAKNHKNEFKIFGKNGVPILDSLIIKQLKNHGKNIISFYDAKKRIYRLINLVDMKEINTFNKASGNLENEKFLVVYKEKNSILYDSTLSKKFEIQSDELNAISDNKFIILKKTGYTSININGRLDAIPYFGKINLVFKNIIKIDNKPLFGVMDTNGDFIIPPSQETINILPGGIFQTINNEIIEYFDINGKQLKFSL